MKLLNKNLVSMLVITFAIGLTGPVIAFAATSPTLTGSESYSVLGDETVTNTGPTTTDGAVGVTAGSAITGFPPGIAGGGTHSNDASAIAAQADNLIAFGTLDQGCDHSYTDGQNLTLLSPLVPGVYCSAGSFLLTGNLTLTGSGVWIFKTVSGLTTSPGSSVTGSDPCNVWWRVGSSATLGTTTSFIGNILALTSISMDTGATLNGRAMAQTGAVTLGANTITTAACSTTVAAAVAARKAAATKTAAELAAAAALVKLPNTGVIPSQNSIPWNIIILTGILAVGTLFVVTQRKKRAI